jgi:hypothetical protein
MTGKLNKDRKVNYMERRNKLNIRYRENALHMNREACMSHRRKKKKALRDQNLDLKIQT